MKEINQNQGDTSLNTSQQAGYVSMLCRTLREREERLLYKYCLLLPIFLASVLSWTAAAFIAKIVVCVSLMKKKKREKEREGGGM